MRVMTAAAVFLAAAVGWAAEPPRVAVLDFDNMASGEGLLAGAGVEAGALSEKGALLLNQQLVGSGSFSVIDRRDFITKIQLAGPVQEQALRPSFIHAAQLLRADAVVRGTLLSLSSSQRTLRPGKEGEGVNFETLTVRVMIQALDSIDGTVLAAEQGKVEREFRQSGSEKTRLGEDDLLTMLEEALGQALPSLAGTLGEKLTAKAERPRVSMTVTATDDPALVEVDGVLVGSTPLRGLLVYRGDHTLTVSRPNYVTISKRLALESDVEISVPMLRVDLTAEERKEILSRVEMKAYLMNGRPDFLIQSLE